MNMRADIAAPAAGPPVARPAGAPALPEAMAVALGPGLAAFAFDDRGGAGAARARLGCSLDGRVLPPPFAATSLELRSGGRRHVLLVGRPLPSLLDRRVLLSLDGRPAAAVEPDWLQPPVEEAAALLGGLTEGARRRLLKLVLTTGASLFGTGGAADLAGAARRLLVACGADAVAPAACVAFGRSHRFLSYRLAGPLRGPIDGPPIALGPDRVGPVAEAAATWEATADGVLVHLHLPRALPDGAELVVLADAPLRLLDAPGGARARPVPAWLDGRGAAARDWALARIEATAGADAAAGALLRELDGDRPEPRLAVRHLSATAEGIVYALDLLDPGRLVRAVRFERGGRRAEVEPHLRVDGGGTLAGTAPLRGPARGGDCCRVALVYGSGRLRALPEAPLPRFDGSVPPGFEAASAEAAAAGRPPEGPALALARARMALVRDPVHAQAQRFGTGGAAVALSLVTGISDAPDAIRARAALVARERGGRGVEVVLVAAEGDGAAAARRVAAEVAAVFGIPHQVVAVEGRADAAERLRAGLARARGAAALMLGPDVLPAREGWLRAWRRRLAAGRGRLVVRGTVLHPDGSMEEAEGAAADCAGLTGAGMDRVLRSALRHPDPAVLLAALDGAGGRARARRADRHPFVRYGSAPRPTAFERLARACAMDLLAGGGAQPGDPS